MPFCVSAFFFWCCEWLGFVVMVFPGLCILFKLSLLTLRYTSSLIDPRCLFSHALFLFAGMVGRAMVLSKLPVPGRPTNFDYSMAQAYCVCRRCGLGLF